MTATIIPLSIQRMVCTGCGAEANASCNCGKPYVPAGKRATDAIRANPEKSDRAIAADLGISDMTVGRARKATATDVAVDRRVGLDGKTRKLPTTRRQIARQLRRAIKERELNEKQSKKALEMLKHTCEIAMIYLTPEDLDEVRRYVASAEWATA